MGTADIVKTASKVVPQCYAYTTPGVPAHNGWTKIGYTERDVDVRIKEQTHTAGIAYKKEWVFISRFTTDSCRAFFKDTHFHAYLKKFKVPREKGKEWFYIEPEAAKEHFENFLKNLGNITEDDADAVESYTLREEQEEAVRITADYFNGRENAEFLWNAKPRFGKTLSAYDLCMKLEAKNKNILIVTNRPAIANSWYSDYEKFFGLQSGYVFVSNVDGIKDEKFVYSREDYIKQYEKTMGRIEFISLQDLKGSIHFGGRYNKLSEISAKEGITWDVLIIDEAHEGVDTYKTDVAFDQIRRKWTLHLSGTPFKALANDKFPGSAIYNWTYADEQKKKRDWDSANESENPYADMPRLSLFTYQMSDIVRDKAENGIKLSDNDITEYAFDLNEFFRTDDKEKFVHEDEVDKFLDALTRQEKFPFSTPELRDELKHTFWLLNRVASAKALAEKLKQHPVFQDYEVILVAGDGKLDDDDENKKAFDKVREAIEESNKKTITLSVGQLTTGITIPEWTAVLMLSNMESPERYVQAAFRAQNPWLYEDKDNGSFYRKKNAYVFDFDPARTLKIFEQFANNLIPETSGHDDKKKNVRELLNFFPVYGEDEAGEMIELDAEKVLTIPRRIHAREVVECGFMSNFLFANIGGVPKEIKEIIKNMQPVKEPKKPHASVSPDENGEKERVIGTANGTFGDKVYVDKVADDINERWTAAIEEAWTKAEKMLDPEKEKLKDLKNTFSDPVAKTLIETAETNGGDLKKITQQQLERKIQKTTDTVVKHEYSEHTRRVNQINQERKEKIKKAQQSGATVEEISEIDEKYNALRNKSCQDMLNNIKQKLGSNEIKREATETIVETLETEKKEAEKKSIEDNIRDHLRGFARTIPAFLMAYGDKDTTLANFDDLVKKNEKVFWEVTFNKQTGKGVTLDEFRKLRDGGDYVSENGEKKHFKGLFDEVVFNEAVQEFIKKRDELANYFEPDNKGDIFDFIPPQRTNQIFTPKKVVKDMVDMLEKENPGCFDDPDATFADLYMKSGMYITEIVTRLYQSKRMKALFPDDAERLNHIFSKQVYGCAPTQIIYDICKRYILGFSDKIRLEENNNIRLCDTSVYAKNGTMEAEMKKLFRL